MGTTTVIITVRDMPSNPRQIADMAGEICRMIDCRVELQFCSLKLVDPAQQTERNPRKLVNTYQSVRCAFPSQILQDEFLSDIASDIHRTNSKIQHLEIESKQTENRKELGHWKHRLLRLKEKRSSIHNMDSHIGFVAVTSGLPVHNGHHLDWASITLSGLEKPLRSVNMIPNIQERSQTPVPLSNWPGKLEGGAKVCKMGSSGVTEEVVNTVPSYMRFGETEHTIPIAIEWAVIPTMKYKNFSEPGDSGAWVVDRLGNHLVGMVLGRNSCLGVSYVTPIREVIEDIENLTNKTVILS
ncbi:uncharacterized protein TRUGW13939_01299 [Talaromyces rugulosus]|uniref:Peptidase S1 domain-containing protein n=1 Tax=Talaromyces rugulosus TaxID=121627 RepID=A0A7H8QJV0_TALRU|nr:uncharacterized protein TRUGW13939_01299 [Talaromyces rugulosus]QKX54214.1 hypothetical protein TRUGW13939_01299 [Talaromyces rugulosus]